MSKHSFNLILIFALNQSRWDYPVVETFFCYFLMSLVGLSPNLFNLPCDYIFSIQTNNFKAEKVIFTIKSFFQDRPPYKVQLPKNFRYSKKGTSIRYNGLKFWVFQERAAYKVQWVKTACTLERDPPVGS